MLFVYACSSSSKNRVQVLCSCVEVNFAVDNLGCCEMIESCTIMSDNLEMHMNCLGHDFVVAFWAQLEASSIDGLGAKCSFFCPVRL